MPLDFASLKAGSKTSATQLLDAVKKANKPNYNQDERYWQPVKDESGSGFAIIRFLPAPEGEDTPFVKLFNYNFKNPETGLYYIENCRSTIGQPDPMNELRGRLYATKRDENIKQAQSMPRKTKFIANILVVKHPARPEDEGKVFLFGFGKKIMEKINALLEPEFDDEVQRNPFDFWNGANFRLKVREVDNFANYDKSEFDADSALSDDDAELERIWKSEYKLLPEIAPDKFKSYDELQAKVNKVLGLEAENVTKSGKHYDNDLNNDVTADREEPNFKIEASDDEMSSEDAAQFLQSLTRKVDDATSN